MPHLAPMIRAAVAQVEAEKPPHGDFPHTGMKPARMVRKYIRAANWPAQMVSVRIVHTSKIGDDGKAYLGYVQTTDILIVPTRWLLRLIELLDKTPLEYISDGKYEE